MIRESVQKYTAVFVERVRTLREWLIELKDLEHRTPNTAVRSEVMDFLPAALEVQQKPPSPAGRWLMWTLLLLFTLAVIWMLVGKVDIVAVAQGKVIPGGKSKTVQSLITGTVSEIHVEDGQTVLAGDALITLDRQQVAAEVNQLQAQLDQARAGLWRTQLLLRHINTTDEELPLSLAPDGLVASPGEPVQAAATPIEAVLPEQIKRSELALANRQYQALLSELDSHDKRLYERESERLTVQSELRKWQLQLPLVTRRSESHQKLANRDHVSQDNLDAIEQQRIEVEQNVRMTENRERQIIAAIDSVSSERARAISAQNASLQSEQHDFQARIAQLEQELLKTRAMAKHHVLSAPVDGSVQQLVVHTIGGVVTPAEPLMKIVPENTQLEVEAMLANKDIGFVSVGQEVKVKVDAFPFTRYGALKGTIESISADAVEVPNVGWVFSTRVSLKGSSLVVEGNEVGISPGMSVVSEIKTGKRRLIEYVLSPLMRYRDESVRER